MTTLNRILLIEDDADALASMIDVLEIEGFVVIPAATIDQAIQFLRDERFGLVVADRQLPDGFIEDRLVEIRDVAGDANVIVVTGFSDMHAVIRSFRQGIADYLIKPILPEDLVNRVNQLLGHRKVEMKLQRELAFSSRLEDTAEAIILVLDFDGRIVRFNRYFTDLTGWEKADLVGELWFDHCIFEEDLGWLKEVFQHALDNGFSRGITNRVVCKDGSARQIRWSSNKLLNDDGIPNLILSIGIDITDLTESNRRQLRSERLAAIGTTVTALAHESRNAIQRIKAAADVLEFDVRGNADSMEELVAIQRAASDLSRLLEDVRSYAAPIQTNRQWTGLAAVWRQAWTDLKQSNKLGDAQLVEAFEACDHRVDVDVDRMAQVFRNLFNNALDAAEDSPCITIGCDCSDDTVELTITDNGTGLDEEQAKQLFDAFYTTKSSGTGLGMAICRRIVEAHGGTIDVACRGGKEKQTGATFRLRLPRVKG
ncbi:MAG: ATP-binding protein [Planctomycetota bacterium]